MPFKRIAQLEQQVVDLQTQYRQLQRIAQLEQQVEQLQTQYHQLQDKHNELVELCLRIATNTLAESGTTIVHDSLPVSERQRRDALKLRFYSAKLPTK
jgi:chromosome segregation ATPase